VACDVIAAAAAVTLLLLVLLVVVPLLLVRAPAAIGSLLSGGAAAAASAAASCIALTCSIMYDTQDKLSRVSHKYSSNVKRSVELAYEPHGLTHSTAVTHVTATTMLNGKLVKLLHVLVKLDAHACLRSLCRRLQSLRYALVTLRILVE
jgi:hypothetical protein